MEEEIWKDIPGYEGLYQASTFGNIRSLDRYVNRKGRSENIYSVLIKGKILKKMINISGYNVISLHKDNKIISLYIHKIILETFVSNPNSKLEGNHIDGNKLNNNISNLEWCTRSENELHKYRILGHKTFFQLSNPNKGKFGKDNHKSKKVNQYDLEGNFIKTWYSSMDIKRELLIDNTSIGRCCNGNGKTAGGFIWKYKDFK